MNVQVHPVTTEVVVRTTLHSMVVHVYLGTRASTVEAQSIHATTMKTIVQYMLTVLTLVQAHTIALVITDTRVTVIHVRILMIVRMTHAVLVAVVRTWEYSRTSVRVTWDIQVAVLSHHARLTMETIALRPYVVLLVHVRTLALYRMNVRVKMGTQEVG
jgi:hypothetical protein